MPLNDPKPATPEAYALLRAAERDWKTVELLLQHPDAPLSSVCFHARNYSGIPVVVEKFAVTTDSGFSSSRASESRRKRRVVKFSLLYAVFPVSIHLPVVAT